MGKRNEQRRQKALARQKAKRKKAKGVNQSFSSAFWGSILLASQGPIYECKIPKRIFEMGIGNIVFSRQLASGKIGLAIFLLDVFCLGVKDAFYQVVDPDKYAGASSVEDLDLNDFESTANYFECPLLPVRRRN